MRYIKNKTEMIMKSSALRDMIRGQVEILSNTLDGALQAYTDGAGNEKALIEGCYGMIEALEKIVGVQMNLNKSPKIAELADFIQKTKAAFKATDLAAAKAESDMLDKAMREKQHVTIH